MAQFKFEGEIQNITNRQLEFINSVIEQQGFKNSKVTFQAVGSVGDNYVANVKRIIVEGKHGNLTMIAKIAPTSENMRTNFQTAHAFGNEIVIYSKVLPKFRQLQKQADVPEDELLQFPKYYGSLDEAPNEVILLEDVKLSGYTILNRFTPLTDYVVRGVLKSLATYHSLSYVLKVKEPETYNSFKESLVDLWVTMAENKDNPAMDFFVQIERISIDILSDYPQYHSMIKDKVVASIERAPKMKKNEDGNRYAVIQHGDTWTNNIMFKFEGDTLKHTMLIDHQIAKHGSPVSDLLYFIFNCTHHDARVEYFYDWLDHYHSELDKSLSNFGIKANYVYPKDQLDADLKRYGKTAMGFTLGTVMLTALKPELAGKVKDQLDSPDLKNFITMGDIDAPSLAAHKKKLVGLLESFNRFGLL